MKLIVGLGNPGEKFEGTRHNIGFDVVDLLARDMTTGQVKWDRSQKHNALLYQASDVLFVKPLTFMNNVGISVGSLVTFYKLDARDVWVVHDDIDLPLGKIRIRPQGGSAGHHGVDSIIAHLKSDQFIRFRLGIGRGMESSGQSNNKNMHHRRVIQFVLSHFRQGEAGEMKHLVKHGMDAVRTALLEGLDIAKNKFH